MNRIIQQGEGKVALRAIELVWEAPGQLPQRGKEASGSVYNQQLNVMPMDPGDVKAAMSLLKQERRRLEAEQPIELDPRQVERSGGERGPPPQGDDHHDPRTGRVNGRVRSRRA